MQQRTDQPVCKHRLNNRFGGLDAEKLRQVMGETVRPARA